jgi:hypothetical protein
MSVLFFMSTVFYWIGVCDKQRQKHGHSTGLPHRVGGGGHGLGGHHGALVREPPDRPRHRPHPGEQPLRSVRVMFCVDDQPCSGSTTKIEMPTAGQSLQSLGAFVMLVVSAAVGFLLWYSPGARRAARFSRLVPALQSWWMKLHVPANFIGYGHLRHVGHGGLWLTWSSTTPARRAGTNSRPLLADRGGHFVL